MCTQHSRDSAGNLFDRESEKIDMGLGLARLARVLQAVDSIFETDALALIMCATAGAAGLPRDLRDITLAQAESLMVVGDDTREVPHLAVDGVGMSNAGRVLLPPWPVAAAARRLAAAAARRLPPTTGCRHRRFLPRPAAGRRCRGLPPPPADVHGVQPPSSGCRRCGSGLPPLTAASTGCPVVAGGCRPWLPPLPAAAFADCRRRGPQPMVCWPRSHSAGTDFQQAAINRIAH